MVVAHPYRRTYRKAADSNPAAYYEMLERATRNQIFSMIDAVEVLNSRGSEEENAFSHEMARWFDLPGTGASDAHKLDDIGTFATEFRGRIRSLDDLIREIRGGSFSPIVLDGARNSHDQP